MPVKKAVITAAGKGRRAYPAVDSVQKAMLPIVDRDGLTKPAIQIICTEVIQNGVENICIICAPGDEQKYLESFQTLKSNLSSSYQSAEWAREVVTQIDTLLECVSFAVQKEPLGYGDAVYQAWQFTGDDPFLLMHPDYLYISDLPELSCTGQVLALNAKENCPVSAVLPTFEHLLYRYGTLSGKQLQNTPGVYQIDTILEKPTVSKAEIELQTAGLRMGYYLCFFGIHLLYPEIFPLLEKDMKEQQTGQQQVQLTPSLQKLAKSGKYLALEVKGSRYDLGCTYGLMQAQMAVGLAGKERDKVLSTIVELLTESNKRKEMGSH